MQLIVDCSTIAPNRFEHETMQETVEMKKYISHYEKDAPAWSNGRTPASRDDSTD